jgi:hypothetical protein
MLHPSLMLSHRYSLILYSLLLVAMKQLVLHCVRPQMQCKMPQLMIGVLFRPSCKTSIVNVKMVCK